MGGPHIAKQFCYGHSGTLSPGFSDEE